MKKIDVLKRAIEKLEGGARHSWMDSASCNCGILAQSCLNMEYRQFENLMYLSEPSFTSLGVSWGDKAENQKKCAVTGIPLHVIFESLFSAGFTPDELHELEYLSNKDILNKTGFSYLDKYYKENLVKYLTAWVSILEEQQPRQAMIEPKEKVRKVYVLVSPEVKKGELVNGLN